MLRVQMKQIFSYLPFLFTLKSKQNFDDENTFDSLKWKVCGGQFF